VTENRWHIFTPFKISNVALKNRIVLAPMGNHLQTSQGEVTDALVSYLAQRAKGGTGLIITPFASVSPNHPTFGAYSDNLLPGLKKLTQRIKKYGTKIFLQIAHLGAMNPYNRIAPSSLSSRLYWYEITPRELDIDEIEDLVNAFIRAGARAKEAGFDGVEFHGGYNYLVGEFYSPHLNKRQDKYGGSFENRMRFLDEVIEGLKINVGESFPVGFKLNVYEHVEGGIDIEEAVKIAKHLEDLGVAYIHVVSSFRLDEICEFSGLPTMYEDSYSLVDLAGRIKREVAIPIIATGGIVRPELAEKIVRDNKADLVAIGRGLIADPQWVYRVERGEKVLPCIKCNKCHIREVLEAEAVRCTVNPEAGIENTTVQKRTGQSKEVLIIGAGPAGMEAALVSAQRGHRVRLFENNSYIGGKLALASVLPFKKPVTDFIAFFKENLFRVKEIRVELSHEMTASAVSDAGADVVICAVGGRPKIPEALGIDNERVILATELLTKIKSDSALNGLDNFIVLGAGLVGCELSLYLRLIGKQVTLVELLGYDEILRDEHPLNRAWVLKRIRELGIPFLCERRLIKIEDGRGIFVTESDREEQFEFNHFVLATGYMPYREFCEDVRRSVSGPPVYQIGDCHAPLGCYNAMHQAFQLANEL
jgi:2,4-dienoyl-CoA reductase-like NADH-dependent reductase (Old Yellow Enzyme family)/thioredoxin reductase